MTSGGQLRHGARARDVGDGNGDPCGVAPGPGVVLDKAPAVHRPSPMSETRCAYWLGQGGRGRRAIPEESHMRVRMRVCAYMGSLYTPVHYVHPVRPFVSNGFRGRGDAGASVQPAPQVIAAGPVSVSSSYEPYLTNRPPSTARGPGDDVRLCNALRYSIFRASRRAATGRTPVL